MYLFSLSPLTPATIPWTVTPPLFIQDYLRLPTLYNNSLPRILKATSHHEKAVILFVACFAATQTVAQPCTKPFAKFSIATNSIQCRSSIIYFIDSTAITGYTWYFGDGGFSKLKHPGLRYSAPGTCSISQYVYKAAGCADSFFKPYTIYPEPVASLRQTEQVPNLST